MNIGFNKMIGSTDKLPKSILIMLPQLTVVNAIRTKGVQV